MGERKLTSIIIRIMLITVFLMGIGLNSKPPTVARAESSFDPGANGAILAIAVQPDGKIVVGGEFTTLGGSTRNHIGRLNADGSLDATFDPGALWLSSPVGSTVNTIVVQPDGDILVGGRFDSLGGTSLSNIGRLNSDGSVDTSFDPGADGDVNTLALQPDGKILVGGYFNKLGGGGTGSTTRNFIGRLNADGSLDAAFDPGANNGVFAIALQADNKILVGGLFTSTVATARNYIARLGSDGSLDAAFNPGANNSVIAILPQPDGKILVGGTFTETASTSKNYIARLNSNGTLDSGFNTVGTGGYVYSLALQADGKILVGGDFSDITDGTGAINRDNIGRLASNGNVDTAFNPGANDLIYALALQGDGKILAGGAFTTLNSEAHNRIGRVDNDAAAQTLSIGTGGDSVTWMRSGAAAEVGRVTFEVSTNGTTYSSLGNGSRITGGWALNKLSLPHDQLIYIRARGFYSSGLENGSGSIVQSIITDTLETADLSIVKLVTPSTAVIGQQVRYRIDYENNGGYAAGVEITDTFPAQFQVTNVSSSGKTITNTQTSPSYVWQVEDLPNGEGGVITVTGSILSTALPGLITNSVEINSTTPEGNSADNSDTAQVTIAKASTTTTLGASKTNPVYGESVTFLATVSTVSPGTGTPTGVVTFTVDGSTVLGTAALNASGQASLSTDELDIGTSSVTATYGGDARRQSSASTAVNVVVGKAATTLALETNASGIMHEDDTIVFTATVSTVSPGVGTPTGMVTFKRGGTTIIGTGQINANGQAVLSKTFVEGSYNISATYGGDATHNGSNSNTVTVVIEIPQDYYLSYIPTILFQPPTH